VSILILHATIHSTFLIGTGHPCRLVAEAAAGRSKRKQVLRQRAENAKKEAIEKAKSAHHKPTSAACSTPKTTTAPSTSTPAT